MGMQTTVCAIGSINDNLFAQYVGDWLAMDVDDSELDDGRESTFPEGL
jgi:hypothetical protein